MTDIFNLMTMRYSNKKIIQIINENNLYNPIDNAIILYIAVKHKNIKIINHLLSIEDLNRNVLDKNTGESPLHLACRKGYIYIVKLLINKSKSDLEFRNINGHRPIVVAYLHGNLSIARFLYDNGSDGNSHKIPKSFINKIITKKNNDRINEYQIKIKEKLKNDSELKEEFEKIHKIIAIEKDIIKKEKSNLNIHLMLYLEDKKNNSEKLQKDREKINREYIKLLHSKMTLLNLQSEINKKIEENKQKPLPMHFMQEYEDILITNNTECGICYEKYEKKRMNEEGRYIRIINNCFHKCCNICANSVSNKCPFCRENIISIL